VGFLKNLFSSRTTNPPGLTDSKWLIEENRYLVRTYEFSSLPPPQPTTTLRIKIYLTMSPHEQYSTRIAYPNLDIHLRPYCYLLRPPRKRFPDHMVTAPFLVGLRAAGSGPVRLFLWHHARLHSHRERMFGHPHRPRREPAPSSTRAARLVTKRAVSDSASMPSDFARRIRRSTGTLEGWTTYTSTPCLISHRANQKPDHPATTTICESELPDRVAHRFGATQLSGGCSTCCRRLRQTKLQ
jgi:hypothetical protein